MAKTDWTMEDFVKAPDLNEIGAEINTMKDEFIKKSIAIPAGADLNTYMTEGSYYCPANAIVDTLLNVPTAEAFHLTVEPHAGVSQTLTTFQPGDLEVFQRNYYFGWGPWKKVPTNAEVSQAETNAKNASLPRTGGTLTGRVDFQTWGSFSADAGGGVLYGSNCYLDPSGSPRTFRYTNTHVNLGARGIFMVYPSSSTGVIEIYEFDTGAVASTAGAAFTPSLKRIINADDLILPNDNPTSNFLSNSSGIFGLNGWTNVGGYPILASSSPDVTGFFYINDAVPSGQYAVLDSAVINVYPGSQYDLQAMFFSVGSPSGTVIQIEVKNESTGATLFNLAADPQKWWHRKKTNFTMPPLVSQVRIRLVVSNAPSGQTKGFARIRFNLRNLPNKDVPYDFTGDMNYIAGELQAVKTSGVDAKQGVVNAINAKGGSASMSDTWAQLAAKIQSIQQGQYQMIDPVSNISFAVPSYSQGLVIISTFATFSAGTRLISLIPQTVENTLSYISLLSTSSSSNVRFALRDSGGNLWDIGLSANGSSDIRTTLLYSTIDLVNGMQTCQYANSYLQYPTSAREWGYARRSAPPGFNSGGPLSLVLAADSFLSSPTSASNNCQFRHRINSM
ncbi:hypothetical protein ABIE27_005019 [Paenibacillus sp. 4624]|uniref:pyocin knob domain-containing protein n=1 Tax=Paenibacillus sp. 4624 TaxID=3156453 RepID=UPI003D240022